MQLQDLLIDRFVEHRKAMAAGQEERVKIVEAEIQPGRWFVHSERDNNATSIEIAPNRV
jgi:hypothetical protein